MSPNTSEASVVQHDLSPETMGALRSLNRAYAGVVVENHRLGLPVIQYVDGRVVYTPTEELLPQALRYLETNGELTPEQLAMHSGGNGHRASGRDQST